MGFDRWALTDANALDLNSNVVDNLNSNNISPVRGFKMASLNMAWCESQNLDLLAIN